MCQFIMFINLLRWIFEFSILIEMTYTFKPFKHDLIFYYKTLNNVYLQGSQMTIYGIYVAGETIFVEIPSDVVDLYDIVAWKVINVNKDRLMFVYNSKPQILINQKTFKTMKYSGILSDSIIALGDNEALHVPTILNPSLTKPSRSWNYIELLYFDSKNEKVSVIRRLPWSKHDDWKFIKEWKMTDYIHFDNKLYLLIKRTIWNDKASNDTQEISIIRLCLEKGDELISSAIEIHFTRPELQINQLIDLIFIIDDPFRETIAVVSAQFATHGQFFYTTNYNITNFDSLFDKTEKDCASGADNVTLLHHHLRSESRGCEVTAHKNRSTKANTVSSSNIYSFLILGYIKRLRAAVIKLYQINLPHPFHKAWYWTNIESITENNRRYFNKKPFILARTRKYVGLVEARAVFYVCAFLKTCVHCLLYGHIYECVWSNSTCNISNGAGSTNAYTFYINYCFAIENISPLIFNSMSVTTLTIELDSPLNLTASQESLVIKAGSHNICTNITINGSYIECSLNLLQSGKFKIELNLMNDNYADTPMLKAISTDLVDISAPQTESYTILTIITILFLGLFVSPVLLIIYTRFNRKHSKSSEKFTQSKKSRRFVGAKSAVTRVESKILPSTTNTLKNSTYSVDTTKLNLSWTTMPSVSHQLYLSKQSKLK